MDGLAAKVPADPGQLIPQFIAELLFDGQRVGIQVDEDQIAYALNGKLTQTQLTTLPVRVVIETVLTRHPSYFASIVKGPAVIAAGELALAVFLQLQRCLAVRTLVAEGFEGSVKVLETMGTPPMLRVRKLSGSANSVRKPAKIHSLRKRCVCSLAKTAGSM